MSETAVQLFSRLGAKESLGDARLHMFSHISGGLLPSDVVELSGAEGTGKTELLLNIVAYCILPKVVGSNRNLGKEVEVVYVCTDYKFDLLRLVTVLEAKVNAAYGGGACAVTVKEAVKSCLSRTYVTHCSSSSELSATLDFLRITYLPRHPEVAAFVLDNVASFYWMDKSRLSKPADRPSLELWVQSVSNLIREHHLVLFVAKPLLIGRTDEAPHLTKSCISDDFMCRQWRQLVKYRFLLQKAGKLPGNTQTDAIFRCTPFPPLHSSQPHTAYYTFTIKDSGVHFMP